MAPNAMLAQVESLPDLIRSEFTTLDSRVRLLLDHHTLLSTKRLVITGCGDSYMAGLATELAFEQLAGIPTEPLTAMQAARYGAIYQPKLFPRNPLTLAISVSGGVARTVEALRIARAEGAVTVAVTATPGSPLAQAAEHVLDCSVPDFAFAPGVRTYRVSLLMLYLLAIRMAEVSDRLGQEEANGLRRELKATADVIEATISAVHERTRQLAETVAAHQNFIYVGDGPNYATALFSAAKVLEAAGRQAMGQESEEWNHLQYFASAAATIPTWFLSPGGRGHNRVAELLEPARRVGRTTVAVVPAGDTAVAAQADWVLPVVGTVREIFSPMVYAVAGELFAAHLADVVGEVPFRGFQGVYNVDRPGVNTIRNSRVMTPAELKTVISGQ